MVATSDVVHEGINVEGACDGNRIFLSFSAGGLNTDNGLGGWSDIDLVLALKLLWQSGQPGALSNHVHKVAVVGGRLTISSPCGTQQWSKCSCCGHIDEPHVEASLGCWEVEA